MWEDVRCEKMWEDVRCEKMSDVRRCEKMWDVRGCQMWEDVKCEKMWEDVTCEKMSDVRRCQMWEDVRRCQIWEVVRRYHMWEDLLYVDLFTPPSFWKTPSLRRSREKAPTAKQKHPKKTAVDNHRRRSEHSVHLVHKNELIQQKVQLFRSRVKKNEANVSHCIAKEAVRRRCTKLQAVTAAELCIAASRAKPSCQTSMTSQFHCAGRTFSSPSWILFFWGIVQNYCRRIEHSSKKSKTKLPLFNSAPVHIQPVGAHLSTIVFFVDCRAAQGTVSLPLRGGRMTRQDSRCRSSFFWCFFFSIFFFLLSFFW